jgi:uncharacterized protein involved in exopolysaccharide biosynthesis
MRLLIVPLLALALIARADDTEKTIADLRAENARLKQQIAELKRLLADAKIAPAADIKQGQRKLEAEITLILDGWKKQAEKTELASVTQVWERIDGDYLERRRVVFGPDWKVETWDDTKIRRD